MPSADLDIRLMQRADALLDPGDRVYMESVLPALAARGRRERPVISASTAVEGVKFHLVNAILDLLLAARNDGDEADELGYAALIAGVVRLYGQTCMVAAPS